MARPYRTAADERDVFRALAHPVRRKIVAAALGRTQSFDELRSLTRRSNAALAGHLRILRDAKVLDAARTGRAVAYRVNRRAMRAEAQWLTAMSAEK